MRVLWQWQKKYCGLFLGLKSSRRTSFMCLNFHLWPWDFTLFFSKWISVEHEFFLRIILAHNLSCWHFGRKCHSLLWICPMQWSIKFQVVIRVLLCEITAHASNNMPVIWFVDILKINNQTRMVRRNLTVLFVISKHVLLYLKEILFFPFFFLIMQRKYTKYFFILWNFSYIHGPRSLTFVFDKYTEVP